MIKRIKMILTMKIEVLTENVRIELPMGNLGLAVTQPAGGSNTTQRCSNTEHFSTQLILNTTKHYSNNQHCSTLKHYSTLLNTQTLNHYSTLNNSQHYSTQPTL